MSTTVPRRSLVAQVLARRAISTAIFCSAYSPNTCLLSVFSLRPSEADQPRTSEFKVFLRSPWRTHLGSPQATI
ncbi:hypothetical protein BDQ94DRAFT_35117 [Aspergillus welwitschiae]|uniref:Uncharacterized protein n=1 Tax=Aspergillus welwitschiae TaxID=1341132 RepID=A0A3F3Q320_9EURO|nr:hypothetical protein BDQ94DRAFT_35117 [Aspergillus welwitschiae]RDH33382.1 hypothetical protein BDQ94DRAFT_35117 [Aspergillus welwitschiae]